MELCVIKVFITPREKIKTIMRAVPAVVRDMQLQLLLSC